MYIQSVQKTKKIYKCRYIIIIMVSIQKRKNGYYLIHSYREGNNIKNVQRYIGTQKPNQEELWCFIDNFSYEVFQKLWEKKIENIFYNYNEIRKELPDSIELKELINFGLKFTYNTNKIEGSTLSRKDVVMIYEMGYVPSNSYLDDIIVSKNHMELYKKMLSCCEEISMKLILQWHNDLFEDTDPNIAGIIRKYPIQISMSNYEPPIVGIEDLMDNLLLWFNDNQTNLNSVYLASIFHLRFESIHPFGDGNGRIGRLLMNYILHRNQYPMVDITFKKKMSYCNALEKAQLNEIEMHFLSWFSRNYIKENKKYLS